MLLSQFKNNLYHACLVNPGEPILVGVSGGADSICLLDLLQKSGHPLMVAHFNHHLRVEAKNDLEFVKEAAILYDLPFIEGEGDVNGFAKKNHKTLEEAARICRYEFLKKEARQNKIDLVAVAHTASDQEETILMHILRGCGLEGLQGMLPVTVMDSSSNIRLIRPLLSYWKEDVLSYCGQNQLTFINDLTNNDPNFFRNRLRLQLMPTLREYNRNIDNHLNNLGKISSRDLKLINQLVINEYLRCLVDENPEYIVFSKTELLKIGNRLLQRVMQYALRKLSGSSIELGFDLIEEMTEFVQKPNAKNHLSLLSNYEISFEGDLLFLNHKQARLPYQNYPFMGQGVELTVKVPGCFKVNTKMTLKTSLVPAEKVIFSEKTTQLTYEAYLDAAKIKEPMMLKCQQSGDCYHPLGLQGKKQKLSDFWINKKIPRRFRSSWPLLFSDNEIAWIPGFQPSHCVQVTAETKMAVKVELISQ